MQILTGFNTGWCHVYPNAGLQLACRPCCDAGACDSESVENRGDPTGPVH